MGARGRAHAADAYTLSWLTEAVGARHWLTAAQMRDVMVRAPQQRLRLLQQREPAGVSAAAPIGPVELLASFDLEDTQGRALDTDRLTQLVASLAGLSYVKIDSLSLDARLVMRTVSYPFALRHVVMPLRLVDDALEVAVENPFDSELLDTLEMLCKRPVVPRVASRKDVLKSVSEIYGFCRSVQSAADQSAQDGARELVQLVHLPKDGVIEATDTHVINAVNYLFVYAFDQGASDIHIEPRRGDTQVRLRIDGVLHDVRHIPRRVHAAMVSRIKTLGRLDVAERRRPQDGRIKTCINTRFVEMRLSTLPTALGEKVVLRLFDPHAKLQTVGDLGFAAAELQRFRAWIGAPYGLVLLTGPTGSGKTTTLYASLRELADSRVNITSIEDPIEMLCDAFNQVAVQPKIGLDFAQALRCILRQDPDVIMVGEIRDAQTAKMAVQAALTGHLVFSTLHTNDSLSAVTRLAELGVAPFLLSAVLVGVMAQRLLRRLCPHCIAPDPQGAPQLAMWARALGHDIGCAPELPQRGRGCSACRQTGYLGRQGLFELFHVDAAVREAIASASYGQLAKLAQRTGRVPLIDGAWAKLISAQTSVEELARLQGPTFGGCAQIQGGAADHFER